MPAVRLLPRVGVRALGTALLGSAALAIWPLPAPAARADGRDLTPAAIEARKAVGLPSVTASPAVSAAVAAVVQGGDAQAAFTSAGGTGRLLTATVPAGGALSDAGVKAVVFDPRLTAIAAVRLDRKVAVAAALDPARPFRAPVLAGAVVDPGIAGSLAVLFPPGGGTIPQMSIQRNRGSQLTSIAIAATAVPGSEGAVLVQLKGRDRVKGPQIGYGLTYELKVGEYLSFTFRTRPVPSVLVARSWQPGPGFTGADRRRFLEGVSSLPPEGRRIVDIIGGAVTVRVLANSAPVCGAPTSCAGFDPGYGYFMILNRAQLHSASGRFVITHELGH